jgi:hypothetical protein
MDHPNAPRAGSGIAPYVQHRGELRVDSKQVEEGLAGISAGVGLMAALRRLFGREAQDNGNAGVVRITARDIYEQLQMLNGKLQRIATAYDAHEKNCDGWRKAREHELSEWRRELGEAIGDLRTRVSRLESRT